MKKCEFCSSEKSIFCNRERLSMKGDFSPGVDVYISNGQLCIESVADTFEPNYTEIGIAIQYCPMCGQKLTERETE